MGVCSGLHHTGRRRGDWSSETRRGKTSAMRPRWLRIGKNVARAATVVARRLEIELVYSDKTTLNGGAISRRSMPKEGFVRQTRESESRSECASAPCAVAESNRSFSAEGRLDFSVSRCSQAAHGVSRVETVCASMSVRDMGSRLRSSRGRRLWMSVDYDGSVSFRRGEVTGSDCSEFASCDFGRHEALQLLMNDDCG
jgi:hypothetical protein